MAAMSGIDIRFHSAEYRQCTVDGKRALFHRWVEKDQLLIQMDGIFKEDRIMKLTEKYKKHGVLPACAKGEKLKVIVALVEFEDGAMAEVEALSVRFLDGREKFDELYWRDEV